MTPKRRRTPRRALGTWAAGLLALLAVSCAAAEPIYEGERRPRDEVAVVTGMSPLSPVNPGVTARIEAVDGEPIEGGATKVELLPGRHEFVVYCNMQGTSGTVTTTADLRAGGSYVVAVGITADGSPDALIIER